MIILANIQIIFIHSFSHNNCSESQNCNKFWNFSFWRSCVFMSFKYRMLRNINSFLTYLFNWRPFSPTGCRDTESYQFLPVSSQISYIIPFNISSPQHPSGIVLSPFSWSIPWHDIATWSLPSHPSLRYLFSSIHMTWPNYLSYACYALSRIGCTLRPDVILQSLSHLISNWILLMNLISWTCKLFLSLQASTMLTSRIHIHI